MPGLALFGFQGEESELEEIEPVAPGEGRAVTMRRTDQVRPRMYFSFGFFPLSFSGFLRGRRVEGGDTSL